MTGANYMGGKRNAVKARSKNPVLRAQKDFFGRQRLGLGCLPKAMLLPAAGTAEVIGIVPSEIDLHHTKRMRRNSVCSEDDFGFIPGPTPVKPPVSRLILDASGGSSRRSKVLDALDETDPMFIRAALDRVLKMPDLAGLLPRAPTQVPGNGAKRRRTELDVGSRDNNKRQHLLSSPADRQPCSPEGQILRKTHNEHDVSSPHCPRPTLANQHQNVTRSGSSLPDSSIPSSDLALTSSPSSLGLRQHGSPEVSKRSHDASKDTISVENLLYQDDPWQALDVLLDFHTSLVPRSSSGYQDPAASRLELNPLREPRNDTQTGATILSAERCNVAKSSQSSRQYLSSDSPPQYKSSALVLLLDVSASDPESNVSRSSKRSHRPVRFFTDTIKPPRSDGQASHISGSEILEVSTHHGASSSRLSSPLTRISSASWNLSPNFALHHASSRSNTNKFKAIDSSPTHSFLEPAALSPAIYLTQPHAADSALQQPPSYIDAASPLPLSEDIGQYSTLLPLDGAHSTLQRQSLGRSMPSSPVGDHSIHVYYDDPAGPVFDEESVMDVPGMDPYNHVSNSSIHAIQALKTQHSAPQLRFMSPINMDRSINFDDELDFPDEAVDETVDQPYVSHNSAFVAQIDTSTDLNHRDLSVPRSPLHVSSLLLRKEEDVYMGPCLFSDEGEDSD